ncbi:hypothetical protein NE236_26275 [Actinoallomurus purpureus]|nr:hypothetical protein [Actinoallomurus purpureus]MCO6008488.1 hypothetical protein [Actinoallomurus purpureus]
MAGVHDEDSVQQFTAYAPDPAFRDRVHSWSLRRGEQDPEDSKIFTIFEGTSEIQRLVIGRTITGLPVR